MRRWCRWSLRKGKLGRSKVDLTLGEVDPENDDAEAGAGLVGFAGAATPELAAGGVEGEKIIREGGDMDESGD